MIRNFLLICLLGCGISLATAGNPPFFTTGTAVNEKGELLMTQKGTRQLDVFAADGKTLLRSYPFKETPTGVLLDGDKAYVTTFEKTGRLEVLSLKSGQIEAVFLPVRELAIRYSRRTRSISMYAINLQVQ